METNITCWNDDLQKMRKIVALFKYEKGWLNEVKYQLKSLFSANSDKKNGWKNELLKKKHPWNHTILKIKLKFKRKSTKSLFCRLCLFAFYISFICFIHKYFYVAHSSNLHLFHFTNHLSHRDMHKFFSYWNLHSLSQLSAMKKLIEPFLISEIHYYENLLSIKHTAFHGDSEWSCYASHNITKKKLK